MLKSRLQQRNQRGDTIVEVLVVLAVLGLAIGISFATANSSLLATKGAQENSQASELLQSQVEALRYMVPTADSTAPDPSVLQTDAPFCLVTSSLPYKVVSSPLDSVADECQQGGPDPANPLYNVSIQFDGTSTYTLIATWDDISGQGKDSVTMVYRLYP